MKKNFLLIVLLAFIRMVSVAQEADTAKSMVSTSGPGKQFSTDTLVKQEASPLDIGKDRGLYIITSDGKMQLRILGSVRYSVLYDMVELAGKKTFNTYYIPTGVENVKVPNYYNDLSNSRLGFEVTRKLETQDVFIRLETDFNGPNGQFRIRHAYGQIGKVLVGQTWSLFSNVSSLPSMVDGNGPTGSVTLRTPQIRYSGLGPKGTHWDVALEYSTPDVSVEDFDTLGISTVQVIPDLTGRFVWEGILGLVQLSSVITTISKKDDNNKVSNSFGIGASLSGTVDLHKKHQLLYQYTYGRSISHFITTFDGTGMDAIINPETEGFESLNSFGGFLSYGFDITKNITTHVSFGYAQLFNKDFQADDAYRNSLSTSVDTFWNITDGAKLGLEYVFGQRWDISEHTGHASRVWALFYYDF